jgi:paraquat-inducible protein B
VRSNTVFYNASGVDLAVGLSGLALRAPSLESVLSGGVEFATPERPGTLVQNGTTFQLEAQPPKGAAEWSPDLTKP